MSLSLLATVKLWVDMSKYSIILGQVKYITCLSSNSDHEIEEGGPFLILFFTLSYWSMYIL